MNKTEIANLALSHAREQSLNGNVDTTDELMAETVLLHYEQALREMLGRVRPRFAQGRKGLAMNAASPDFEYAHSFILPTDYVEMVRFNGDEVMVNDDFYEIEGRNLLTDEGQAKIVYIRYETDTSLYEAEFIEAFALLLASKIVNARRGDKERAESLLVQSERKASESSTKAAQSSRRYNSRDKVQRSSRWTGSTRRKSTNETTNGNTGVSYDA